MSKSKKESTGRNLASKVVISSINFLVLLTVGNGNTVQIRNNNIKKKEQYQDSPHIVKTGRLDFSLSLDLRVK